MIKTLITTVLMISISAHATATDWNLNDVSYLFKIPQSLSETSSHLLSPTTKGLKGELLPSHVFRNLPPVLNSGDSNGKLYTESLKVVSVRVDPCPDLEITKCSPEIRMVWQPVQKDSYSKKWMTRDGAVHTFYRLSKAEFKIFKAELWKLKKENMTSGISTDKKPLGVHPAFISKKTNHLFTKKLTSALLEHCGEKNFEKITFMSLLVPTRWWRFGSFEKNESNTWKSPVIPRLNDKIEDLFNTAMEPTGSMSIPAYGMDSMINILPVDYPKEDKIFEIISDGYRFNDDRDLPIFKVKLGAVDRFRNPHKTNPNTLNCSSCHYADAAKTYSERRFESLKGFETKDAYQNPDKSRFDLTNNTIAPKSSRIVRAFGYFAQFPAINQRVINDSAESAIWMNKLK